MELGKSPAPARRVATLALLAGALGTGPAAGQTPRDTAQSAAEQRRADERDARQREQAVPEPEVRPDAPQDASTLPLPTIESPCFVIRHIELRDGGAPGFGWMLDALTAPDSPLDRCLGTGGIGVLLQRAQQAAVARGFVTSRVVVEPQQLQQGRLLLTLLPGRIRQVRFAQAGARHPSMRGALPAQAGDLLNLRDIEQALENFKRVPGVEIDIRIEPADEPGQSDLLIHWTQGRALRLQLGVDDSGSRSTGRHQGSATLSLANPLHLNDLFYLGLQGSLGGGDPGARGTSGSSLHYSLPWGRALLSLDLSRHRYLQTVAGAAQDYAYRGLTGSQDLSLSYLLHRDATRKTTLHAKAFARQSRNFIDDTEVQVQRRRVGGWQLGIAHRAHVGPGTLDLNLGYRRGTGAFGSLRAPEEAFGEGTSRFALWQAGAQWHRPFRLGAQTWQFSTQWRGQAHRTPLSPSERFAIGARHTVRGFDGEFSLSADSGWFWRNELATPLGDSGSSAFAGIDHGQVRGPGAAQLPGTRLSGAVLGLRGSAGAARAVQYEVFAGWPLHKPDGFRTANATVGFWLTTGF
ncbi:MAG: ShlB/FhaC/HecB family hemolysin secretion/activation protein [Hydrogenophaga sp.]|uniref:ShlB/FhaC/HecB family hemolysin secretion/activation protein n=1 Tax=Hydrogenophaga sp. TaxID=1904254 RepID=UPI0026331F1F|nr:ShlB/FhaC/HecB family hemolysin secretion/activation protein [Hydrogenophaga sp.]MDM7944270.1 ShlB/FhaC/HecB family hemolysin secretion/activation protein [Hydrogenophaga sp.]